MLNAFKNDHKTMEGFISLTFNHLSVLLLLVVCATAAAASGGADSTLSHSADLKQTSEAVTDRQILTNELPSLLPKVYFLISFSPFHSTFFVPPVHPAGRRLTGAASFSFYVNKVFFSVQSFSF